MIHHLEFGCFRDAKSLFGNHQGESVPVWMHPLSKGQQTSVYLVGTTIQRSSHMQLKAQVHNNRLKVDRRIQHNIRVKEQESAS